LEWGADIVLVKTTGSRGAASGTRLGRGAAGDSLPFGDLIRQRFNLRIGNLSSGARVVVIIIIIIIIIIIVRAKTLFPSSALGLGVEAV
jgi:hypothetical protein